jgi:hypothetical protein
MGHKTRKAARRDLQEDRRKLLLTRNAWDSMRSTKSPDISRPLTRMSSLDSKTFGRSIPTPSMSTLPTLNRLRLFYRNSNFLLILLANSSRTPSNLFSVVHSVSGGLSLGGTQLFLCNVRVRGRGGTSRRDRDWTRSYLSRAWSSKCTRDGTSPCRCRRTGSFSRRSRRSNSACKCSSSSPPRLVILLYLFWDAL